MESRLATDTRIDFVPIDKIYPHDLKATLDFYADKIQVLSLDCFDTLLWRHTATPIDAFYGMQKKPTFASLGINATLRARLEAQARNLRGIEYQSNEVKLENIYLTGFPDLTPEQLAALTEEELKTEIEICHAFQPVVELIRAARDKKIKIIIVSNTYLDKPQLHRLLAQHLPDDTINAIDQIFCSCEYGKSKNSGLFDHVLEKLAIPAEAILHIGDDLRADLYAARKSNINALQLIPYNDNVKEFLRLRNIAANLFNPNIRHNTPLFSPFKALLASNPINSVEEMIGHISIGPIIYTFAQFIIDEVNQLKAANKKPKVLFLLRDAYLPAKVCEALAGEEIGTPVYISRFAAFAATFKSAKEIYQYLSENIATGRFKEMAKQLLLPKEIIEPLLEVIRQSNQPIGEFLSFIKQKNIQNIIINNSAAYRKRLIRHFEKKVGLQRGDTLVFVDLGYSGTAQRLLEPIFKEELDVQILGRYLIQLNISGWESSRRGLIDPSWCDDRSMLSLVSYIALLEQICTSNEKSLVDYDETGDPIFSTSGFDKNQYEKLQKIQHECLRFAKIAQRYFQTTKALPMQILREAVAADLGRFIFLPTESEVNYLESFKFDLNLGTHDILQIFDQEKGLASLKKRGLFFSFMEKNKQTMRTNYPAELRTAGLELVITLLAQHRFSLDIGLRDMSLRRESIQLKVKEEGGINTTSVEACLTYDGYYSLTVPVSKTGFTLALLFGKKYQWVEIENAELLTMDSFLNQTESLYAEDAYSLLQFNEMDHKGGKLYECCSLTSSLGLDAPQKMDKKNYLIRLVFRPIVRR